MKNIRLLDFEGVAEVILARPDLRNAFNPEMIAEITLTFKALAKRKDLRAIVLRGEGKSFCAGADLGWMKEMAKYSLAKNKKDSEKLFEMFAVIDACPLPVIGLVQGAAFGGALGLMACCDIVVAEEQTQFCFSEVKLGLVPAVISHFVLKKAILGFVAPLMLLGRVFSSQEAERAGLVHSVVNSTDLEQTKNALLNQLGDVGPEAVRETKKLIHKLGGLTPAKAKAETTKVIAARRVSSEGQEGLKAFFDKKNPLWKTQWRPRT
jgi:methylglutaconyl-CoA hydratase